METNIGDIGYATLNYGYSVGSFIEKVEILEKTTHPAQGGAEYEILTVKVIGNDYTTKIIDNSFHETYYGALYHLLFELSMMFDNINRQILNKNGKPTFMALNGINQTEKEKLFQNQTGETFKLKFEELSSVLRKYAGDMSIINYEFLRQK